MEFAGTLVYMTPIQKKPGVTKPSGDIGGHLGRRLGEIPESPPWVLPGPPKVRKMEKGANKKKKVRKMKARRI